MTTETIIHEAVAGRPHYFVVEHNKQFEIYFNETGNPRHGIRPVHPRAVFSTRKDAENAARSLGGHLHGDPNLQEAVEVKPPCACQAAQEGPPLTEGRLVQEGEASVGEPLIGIAEGLEIACCGPCNPVQGGSPKGIQVERVKARPDKRGYDFERTQYIEFPAKLVKAYEQAAHDHYPACLPWVRITRDPTRFRECMRAAAKLGPVVSSDVFYDLIKEHMVKEDQEVFYVALLDTQLSLRGISELARGARDRVGTPIPDVLRLAIVDGAMACLVAHNHPSGKAMPSEADKHLTKSLEEAFDTVGIQFMDHIIVGADGYYSFDDKKFHKRA